MANDTKTANKQRSRLRGKAKAIKSIEKAAKTARSEKDTSAVASRWLAGTTASTRLAQQSKQQGKLAEHLTSTAKDMKAAPRRKRTK